ncbi:MAG: HlyC/CorC family transporter [Dehalococcoidales bacterium]|nr:MAG: HlyC/CorC family transporter [Dehalococcoidales bacterium]
MSDSEIPLYIGLLVLCLLLSAFFSSSETAFFFLQKIRVEHLVDTQVKGARRVARMIENPGRLLSVILLGNNLVNTAAVALATAMAIRYWPEQAIIITTVGLTVILLIFCETVPKTIATQHAERMSLIYARPIQLLWWLFFPFVSVLSWMGSGFSKLIGGEPGTGSMARDEEIRTMISVGHKEGEVEEAEAVMLNKVFDFGDRPVREVMVPRPEVIAIGLGSRITDFLTLYAEFPLSRFPVYQENMDNVVGILAIKDVLMARTKGKINDGKLIDELVRPAWFAPESKRISELFIEMQEENYRMAIIVDEYGGTAGIVTLTRLVEEIVGPVGDELAMVEKDYKVIDEFTYQVDGGMRVEEVNEEMDLELPEGDYETLAGFILDLIGHIPKENEQVRYQDLKLVVTEMRGLKIEKIQLTKESHATAADQT